MILTTELQGDRSLILVITGNGRNEEKILQALAPKFNGRKQLYWPKPPILRKTGLKALEAVKVYAGLIGLSSLTILFLVDREHVGNMQRNVPNVLRKIGVEVKDSKEIQGRALHIEADIGGKNICVYVVVFGEVKCLEENISELLKCRGYDVKPNKSEIKKLLRKIGKNLAEIVETTSFKDLEKAFPSLIETLKKLEEDH